VASSFARYEHVPRSLDGYVKMECIEKLRCAMKKAFIECNVFL
jgi:hypothetical protein